MIHGLVVNTWRVWQSQIVMTYIAQYSQVNEGSYSSNEQNRWQCWDHPFDDLILQPGIDLLKFIGSQKYLQSHLMLSTTGHSDHHNEIVSADYTMCEKLDGMRRKGQWP